MKSAYRGRRSARLLSPSRWLTALVVVTTALVAGVAVAPARAAAGDLGVSVAWVDTTNTPVTDLQGTAASQTDLQARLVGLQIGYSCGPVTCTDVALKIDPMPLDPTYGSQRFASLNSITLPTGATRSGSAAIGYTISLGSIAAGSSGSFVALYTYQTRPTAPAPQSFFPEGYIVHAGATITGTGLTSATSGSDVTWHIQTPSPGVSFYNQSGSSTTLNQATADSDYTYTDYQTTGCEWTGGGHGEPQYECAASYTVTQTLPAGVQFVSASDGGVFDAAANAITWAASGLAAAPGWGLLTAAGSPRTVVVRYPSSMVADPANCVIDITTTLATDVTFLSGAKKSATTSATHKLNGCQPFGAGASAKFSTVSVADPTDSIVWAGSSQQWTVRVYNSSNVSAVGTITETFDQAGLPVNRVQSPNGAAVIHAVLDDGQIVDVTSTDWTAPAGRTVVSATVQTPVIAGPNTSASDQSKSNFVPIRFSYTVSSPVPSGGFTRTNTAGVTLSFPDNPALGTIDVGTKSATVLVTPRPAQLKPTISSTVPGGGNPVAGQNVTFTMTGSTQNQDAGVQLQPQYVFVAPTGWTIAPGSASIPGLADVAFEYRSVSIAGQLRQAVVAHRPAGTVWGVNSTWPTMTVQAAPSVSVPANTVSTATFYQGDAAHTYGPRDAIWGAASTSAFGDNRYDDAADLDGDGVTTESFAYATTALRVGSAAGLNVLKEICLPDLIAPGGCNWVADSTSAVPVSPQASGIQYRITITNGGNTALAGVVAYDVLPFPGDTGLTATSATTSRGSTFTERLGSVSANTGATLTFSTSTNPCRAEVYPSAPDCTSDWGGTVNGARAIRASVTGSLAAGASVSFTYLADVAGSPSAGAIACNSVAIASSSTPATEPPSVCAVVQAADLAASAPSSVSVQIGRPSTVPLTFTNVSGTTTSATVTLEIGDGVSVSDLAPTGWTCTTTDNAVPVEGPATLTCSRVGTFAEGDAAQLDLQVVVTDPSASITASVTGDVFDPVTANNSTEVSFQASAAAASLGLTKSDARRTALPGDQLTYEIAVTNPLDFEALGAVTVTDTLPAGETFVSASDGGTATGSTVTWTLAGLAAQETRTVTLTVVVADDAPNLLENRVHASAADPVFPDALTATASDADEVSRLGLTKTAAFASTGDPVAGETLTFTFTVTNTGAGTLTGVAIEDPLPGLGAVSYEWPGSAGVLAAGQHATATAGYLLTQSDIDSGTLRNAAMASAADADVRAVRANASVDVPISRVPGITLTKTAQGDLAQAGDIVTFTLVAKNTGNVTLTDVTFTDALPGLSAIDITWAGGNGVLLPDESATATATYRLLQSDVDQKSVQNTAQVTAEGPGGARAEAESTVTVAVPAVGKLSFEKTGVLAAGATGTPGDIVTWTFTVQNVGPTGISHVAIVDKFPGLSAVAYADWPSADGQLAPGESVTATATSSLTAAEIAHGFVENLATVAGAQFDGTELTAEDTARVDIPKTSPAMDPMEMIGQLAHTGAVLPIGIALVALALIASGGTLIALRRRRKAAEL